MREVRVSPDRDSVAIRSDWPADNWNAWAVMNAVNGGHWSATSEVENWDVVTVPAAAPAAPSSPTPDPEPEPEPAPAPEPDPYGL